MSCLSHRPRRSPQPHQLPRLHHRLGLLNLLVRVSAILRSSLRLQLRRFPWVHLRVASSCRRLVRGQSIPPLLRHLVHPRAAVPSSSGPGREPPAAHPVHRDSDQGSFPQVRGGRCIQHAPSQLADRVRHRVAPVLLPQADAPAFRRVQALAHRAQAEHLACCRVREKPRAVRAQQHVLANAAAASGMRRAKKAR